MGTDKKTSQSS